MTTRETIHKNIRISGRVQGVGFRYSAMQAALALGVTGFVKNLYSGEVYVEAEGTAEQVDEFIEWCRQGPPRARIDHIDITVGEVAGFTEFRVR